MLRNAYVVCRGKKQPKMLTVISDAPLCSIFFVCSQIGKIFFSQLGIVCCDWNSSIFAKYLKFEIKKLKKTIGNICLHYKYQIKNLNTFFQFLENFSNLRYLFVSISTVNRKEITNHPEVGLILSVRTIFLDEVNSFSNLNKTDTIIFIWFSTTKRSLCHGFFKTFVSLHLICLKNGGKVWNWKFEVLNYTCLFSFSYRYKSP